MFNLSYSPFYFLKQKSTVFGFLTLLFLFKELKRVKSGILKYFLIPILKWLADLAAWSLLYLKNYSPFKLIYQKNFLALFYFTVPCDQDSDWYLQEKGQQ